MTVSSIIPVNNYEGNGSNKRFDFDFLIESTDELLVTLLLSDGNKKILNYGIDYSINEIKNKTGSYITFPLEQSTYKVLQENERISLALNLEIKQESEFENSSYLKLNVLEWTFDYIVRILQMLSRKIDRSVKIQEGSDVSADKLVQSIIKSEADAKEAASIAENKANEASISAERAFLYSSKTDSISKTYVTNCILETPQRIKLDIVNDTPVLRKGSIVFINGQDYVLTQDATASLGSNTVKDSYLFYHRDSNNLIVSNVEDSLSGATLPTLGEEYSIFYNTSDKSVYRFRNGNWSKQYGESLPIAKIRLKSENKIGQLINIYDWYSVCGKTIVVFPNVKVLMANGLNTDGTKKNLEVITNFSQATITLNNISRYLFLNSNGQLQALGTARFGTSNLSDLLNVPTGVLHSYIPELNTWYERNVDGGEWTSTNSPITLLLSFSDNASIVSKTAPFTILSVANKDEVVDLYSSQEIPGFKTFLESLGLRNSAIKNWSGVNITNPEFDLTNYTNAQLVTGGRFLSMDKNKDFYSSFQAYKGANNSKISSQMIARSYINGDKTKPITASIEVSVNSLGNRYTYAPPCSEVNSILTTVQITETDSGIGIKLGNGLILQFGTSTAYTGPNQEKTISLPVPFTTSAYIVTSGHLGSSDVDDNFNITTQTTTTFNLKSTSVGHTDSGWNLKTMWFAIGF